VGLHHRGRGTRCTQNAERAELLYEAERRIPVEWAGESKLRFRLVANFHEDRTGILAATAVISDTA